MVASQARRSRPASGFGTRLRPERQELGHAFESQRTELSPERRRLAGRSPSAALRHTARGGDRLRQVPGRPGVFRNRIRRRADFPDAPVPDQPDEPGPARARPRRPTSTPGSGRTPSAGLSSPTESSRACESPAPRLTSMSWPRDDGPPSTGEDPRKALEGVARAWAEQHQGPRAPKRQLWHYRRSLNLRATSLEPPKPGT